MMNDTTLRIERFPYGCAFAVSLVDDTDGVCLASMRPVYDLLADRGIGATKTVWPLPAVLPSGGLRGGSVDTETETLEDAPYRRYCQSLLGRGFEMAMHGASGGDNTRERTLLAYQVFEDTFGAPPATNVMHGRNRENIYWGRSHTDSPLWRGATRLHGSLSRYPEEHFEGHDPTSPYFWGDICREKTRYVRFFETLHADTLTYDRSTPYHLRERPFVPWWFSSSYGAGTRLYELLSPRNLARLRSARGASIIHTYLWQFASRGNANRWTVRPRFAALAARLALTREAWCVPVVQLLDRLRAVRGLRWLRDGRRLALINPGPSAIDDLALRCPVGIQLADQSGRRLSATRNSLGQVRLGRLEPGASLVLWCNRPVAPEGPGLTDGPNLSQLALGTARRILWQHRQTYSSPRNALARIAPRLGTHPQCPWIDALEDGGSGPRLLAARSQAH